MEVTTRHCTERHANVLVRNLTEVVPRTVYDLRVFATLTSTGGDSSGRFVRINVTSEVVGRQLLCFRRVIVGNWVFASGTSRYHGPKSFLLKCVASAFVQHHRCSNSATRSRYPTVFPTLGLYGNYQHAPFNRSHEIMCQAKAWWN